MTQGRFVFYLLLLAAAAAYALTFHPDRLFQGYRACGELSFRAHEPLDAAGPVFADVCAQAGSGYFSRPGTPFEIYLTRGDWEYLALAPFCRGTSACVHPVSGKIFAAPSDLEAGTVPAADSEPRALSRVLVHALAKAQLRNALGFFRYSMLPAWKKDGYAEYAAGETAEMPVSALCGGEGTDAAWRMALLEDRLMIEMLERDDGDTLARVMERDQSHAALRARLMKKHCR